MRGAMVNNRVTAAAEEMLALVASPQRQKTAKPITPTIAIGARKLKVKAMKSV